MAMDGAPARGAREVHGRLHAGLHGEAVKLCGSPRWPSCPRRVERTARPVQARLAAPTGSWPSRQTPPSSLTLGWARRSRQASGPRLRLASARAPLQSSSKKLGRGRNRVVDHWDEVLKAAAHRGVRAGRRLVRRPPWERRAGLLGLPQREVTASARGGAARAGVVEPVTRPGRRAFGLLRGSASLCALGSFGLLDPQSLARTAAPAAPCSVVLPQLSFGASRHR